MALVLHAASGNKNTYKILIAAEYNGIQIELVKDFEFDVSNKTPEFLKMNPMGKVPVLETPEGPICESNAIARYVSRLKTDTTDTTLYGSSLVDYVEEIAVSKLKRALEALNTHLSSKTYLVGHTVTLADIIMTCNLSKGFKFIMTKTFTKDFPYVERYFWTMVNQPNIKKILGEVEQAKSVPPIQKKPAQPAKQTPKDEPKK